MRLIFVHALASLLITGCSGGTEGLRDAGTTPGDASQDVETPDGRPLQDARVEGGGEACVRCGDGSTCEPGYMGSECEECAPGYVRDVSGVECTPDLCTPNSCENMGGLQCQPETGACCGAGACRPGATRCVDGAQHTCVGELGCGVWTAPTACAAGCQDGERCAGLPPTVRVDQWGVAEGELTGGMAVAEDGTVFVAGTWYKPSGAGSTEAVLWERGTFGGTTRKSVWSTEYRDSADAVAVGPGGRVVFGGTTGARLGEVDDNVGSLAFATELDPQVEPVWVARWADVGDLTLALAFGKQGSVFVGGATFGSVATPNAGVGFADAVLCLLDAAGAKQWCDQFGTSEDDEVLGVAYDASGDVSYSVGYTEGSLDGEMYGGDDDPFLAKHDAAGNRVWTRVFGTSRFERALGVLVDPVSGDVFTVGSWGAFARWAPDGTMRWSQSADGSSPGPAVAVVRRESGEFITVGWTSAVTFDGQTSAGDDDVFVAYWSVAEDQATFDRADLYGTAGKDTASAAVLTQDDVLYVAGHTTGAFEGFQNAGGDDPFVLRIELD